MVVSIEQHVDWVVNCIAFLLQHRFRSIEATVEAEDAWVEHVQEVANATLYPSRGLLVRGGECSRQTSSVHALHRRNRPLS